MIIWFLYGPEGQLVKRGGTGGEDVTSYGTGPPSSTVTKWRGVGSGPEIAGSTGGFIGLIVGIVVVVVVGVFAGIYFYNRHRRRLPRQSKAKSRLHNPLPSLSFTRPSTDPYAEVEIDGEGDGETPRARGGSSRPGYARQSSYEWEIPMDSPHGAFDLPAEPDEVALPLRRKSPRPVSPVGHYAGESPIKSSTTNNQGKGKGKERVEAGVNPFDSPYDSQASSTIPLRGGDMVKSAESHPADGGSGIGGNQQDPGYLQVGKDDRDDDDGSSAGDDSDRSLRVSDIRQGTRFVERFESKESLV